MKSLVAGYEAAKANQSFSSLVSKIPVVVLSTILMILIF
jgi:hypothetical protein